MLGDQKSGFPVDNNLFAPDSYQTTSSWKPSENFQDSTFWFGTPQSQQSVFAPGTSSGGRSSTSTTTTTASAYPSSSGQTNSDPWYTTTNIQSTTPSSSTTTNNSRYLQGRSGYRQQGIASALPITTTSIETKKSENKPRYQTTDPTKWLDYYLYQGPGSCDSCKKHIVKGFHQPQANFDLCDYCHGELLRYLSLSNTQVFAKSLMSRILNSFVKFEENITG